MVNPTSRNFSVPIPHIRMADAPIRISVTIFDFLPTSYESLKQSEELVQRQYLEPHSRFGEEIGSSSEEIAVKFNKLSNLPKKLQIMIWKADIPYFPTQKLTQRKSPLFHACFDSRSQASRSMRTLYNKSKYPASKPLPRVFANPSVDIVRYLGSWSKRDLDSGGTSVGRGGSGSLIPGYNTFIHRLYTIPIMECLAWIEVQRLILVVDGEKNVRFADCITFVEPCERHWRQLRDY